MHFTYILRCGDGSLYTGYTTDIQKRIKTHNAGKGAKYTRARLPVTLAYLEESGTKQEAMRREAAIKKLTRPQKEELIAEYARAHACSSKNGQAVKAIVEEKGGDR